MSDILDYDMRKFIILIKDIFYFKDILNVQKYQKMSSNVLECP